MVLSVSNLQSAIRPRPNQAETPMTKPPTTLGEIPELDEGEVQPQDDQGSSADFANNTRPKFFSQEETNNLVNDLGLTKRAC